MTTKERVLKSLTDRGMFDAQAEAVFEQAKTKLAETLPTYRITWDRPASEYPDPFYAVVGMTINVEALKWIDANAPEAWFRPLFDSSVKVPPITVAA